MRGGDALLSATRVLRHEAVLDMKVNRISLRTVLNSNVSVKRSAYKWCAFVCCLSSPAAVLLLFVPLPAVIACRCRVPY